MELTSALDNYKYLFLLTSLALLLLVLFFIYRLIYRLLEMFTKKNKVNEDIKRNRNDVLVDVLLEGAEHAKITAGKLDQRERAYESLHSMYQTVMAYVPIGMVVVDEDRCILFSNPQASTLIGDCIDGKELKMIWPDLDRFFENRHQKTSGDNNYVEMNLNGKKFWLDIRLISLPDNQYLITLQDKTKLRRLEQSIQMNRELTLMGEMAGGITHEVKNVLAVIKGHAQLMDLTEENEDHVNSILHQTDRLLSVIKRFMDSSRQVEPVLKELCVGDWFKTIRDECAARFGEDKVVFELKADPLKYFRGDPVMLSVLFENLILNGLDACETLSETEPPFIKVLFLDSDSELCIFVEDKGIGFPHNILKKIFVPFVTSKENGTGLGLFQCRKIVHVHGGTLEINENPTRLICTFPLQ